MKKGLVTILEQPDIGGRTPSRPDSGNSQSGQQGSVDQGVSSSDAPVDNTPEGDDVVVVDDNQGGDLKDKLAGLMKTVNFYNGQSETPIRFDEEDALNSISSILLPLEAKNQINNENRDDLFVEYMVQYLVGKKKHPLYFEYDPRYFKIEFDTIQENNFIVGLESLLIESRAVIKEQSRGADRGYILYSPGSSKFDIVSSELSSSALEKVKSAYVRKTQKPVELEQKPQQGQPQNQQTPEQPEKRPEEEMGVNPKAEMIKKKAEKKVKKV